MALKKKSDLCCSLWSSADELRGSMGASQHNDYVTTLIFVKSVSDKPAAVPDAPIKRRDELNEAPLVQGPWT